VFENQEMHSANGRAGRGGRGGGGGEKHVAEEREDPNQEEFLNREDTNGSSRTGKKESHSPRANNEGGKLCPLKKGHLL